MKRQQSADGKLDVLIHPTKLVAVGPGYNDFITCLSLIVHQNARLNVLQWKKVPQSTRDTIVQSILDDEGSNGKSEANVQENDQRSQSFDSGSNMYPSSPDVYSERMTFTSETPSVKNLGGISLSISVDSARKNAFNVDKSDGIVGIIGKLGALVASGHLRRGSCVDPDTTRKFETNKHTKNQLNP